MEVLTFVHTEDGEVVITKAAPDQLELAERVIAVGDILRSDGRVTVIT